MKDSTKLNLIAFSDELISKEEADLLGELFDEIRDLAETHPSRLVEVTDFDREEASQVVTVSQQVLRAKLPKQFQYQNRGQAA